MQYRIPNRQPSPTYASAISAIGVFGGVNWFMIQGLGDRQLGDNLRLADRLRGLFGLTFVFHLRIAKPEGDKQDDNHYPFEVKAQHRDISVFLFVLSKTTISHCKESGVSRATWQSPANFPAISRP